jgi:hypothetical protein
LHVIALPRRGEMMTESIFGLESWNLPSIFTFLCFPFPLFFVYCVLFCFGFPNLAF